MPPTPTETPSNADSEAPAWSASELRLDPHEASDKAERVQRMFAAIASSYDRNNRLHSFWQDQRWRRRGVRLAAMAQGADVVDVACGTGDLAEAFHDAGAGRVIGIDFTPEMLEVARNRAVQRGRDQIEYRQGDAMSLDLESDSADVLSIAFGIRNVTDPARALSEFRRVLKPGGRLLILEFSEPTNPLFRALNTLYVQRIMPVTASIMARDRSGAYKYLPRSIRTFLPRQELERAITEAGFENIQQFPMTFGVCVAYLAS